jgi:hypothetical protein
LEKVTKGNVTARLKEIKFDPEGGDEADALDAWMKLCNEEAAAKKAIKDAEAALDGKALAKYPILSKDEVKTLVVTTNGLPASPPPSTDGPYQPDPDPVRENVGRTLRDSTAPRRESGS